MAVTHLVKDKFYKGQIVKKISLGLLIDINAECLGLLRWRSVRGVPKKLQKVGGFLEHLLVSKVNQETTRFTLKLPSAGFDPVRACLHGLCTDQPRAIEPTKEPPFVSLRSRISEPDVADFEFLLTLNAFSARELQGYSYLESDHIDLCLRVARKMRAEKLSPSSFQELLAEAFVDWNPAYVSIRRAFDIKPALIRNLTAAHPFDLNFQSEPHFLDIDDFSTFCPMPEESEESAGPLGSLLGAWDFFLSWFSG